MAKRDRRLLRPEDATSWEEFQARCTVEQAQCRAANSSWRAIGQAVFVGVFAIVVIFFWFVVATTSGPARWAGLAFALITTWIELWVFGKGMRRGFGGSKRYMELSRLQKEWQTRAERGQIPQTSPGGPKVWRDELEPSPKSR
jgi:hypothetical protein